MMRVRLAAALAAAIFSTALGATAAADPLVVDRNGAAVSVEPYAPGVVRVTISLDRDLATAAPGYGISAKPDESGWTHATSASGDTLSGGGISVEVPAQPWPHAPSQMERYFVPSLPPVSVVIHGADGHVILRMYGWEMAPHDGQRREDLQGRRQLLRRARRAFLRPRPEPGRHPRSARPHDRLPPLLRCPGR